MLIVPDAADSASDTFGIDMSNKQPPRHFCFFISIICTIKVCTSDLGERFWEVHSFGYVYSCYIVSLDGETS